MSRSTIVGIVAAASIGVAALVSSAGVSSEAFAKDGFGHWHHHVHSGSYDIAYIGGRAADGCHVVRRVPTEFGHRLRTVNVCD